MSISPLTNNVLAYSVAPDFNTDICIDWAIEMIRLGYTNDSILILAGLSKPTNYFEITAYLNNAFDELGLTPKTGEDGIVSYSSYYIFLIACGKDVKRNLGIVHNLCLKLDYDSVIYDFSLLQWAWDDLDFDQNAFPHYWENATIENIEQLVINASKVWLEKNKHVYLL